MIDDIDIPDALVSKKDQVLNKISNDETSTFKDEDVQALNLSPQPKQKFALMRKEFEILYGGSRGGGKTIAGIMWLLYGTNNKDFRALVIRRNADDLKDWIDRANGIFSTVGAKLSGISPFFTFPSGAIIRTGHLKDENAYSKYQGHEYQNILIEELTHISSEDDYEKLLGSCRSTVTGISPQVFATTNPDGPGFTWVKKRWHIPDYPKDPIITEDPTSQRRRIFIPSWIEDNDKLMKSDPSYVRYLDSIKDPDLRKAWREGHWTGTSIKGSYYGDELNLARKEKRITTIQYDRNALVHTVWDLGVSDQTVILFAQKIGNMIYIIDYYSNSGEGLQHYIDIIKNKGYLYGRHYAPHDIEFREHSTGLSRLDAAEKLGLSFEVVPRLHVATGIDIVRRVFNRLVIAESCDELIASIAAYRKEWDDKRGIYKDKPVHDASSHYADALRYLCTVADEFDNNIYTQPLINPHSETSDNIYGGI